MSMTSTTPIPGDAPGAANERFIPGAVLGGRYRIVERIGHGGSGEVYRAHDLKLGQRVALKFLSESLRRDPSRYDLLVEEVRAARRVTHPNVCRVHDLEELDGVPFVAMELVDGEDLAQLLARIGRLPSDKAIQTARELCHGLNAIHEGGVLHRDLKPANVMIDGRGRVRITDFGLALRTELHPDGATIAGTPAYMAPEVLLDQAAPTVRSDIYSLGLILYESFTGRRVWDAATLSELLRVRRGAAPPRPSVLRPDIDPAVDEAIVRCLETHPERRPASARALAALLPGAGSFAAIAAEGDTPPPDVVAAGGLEDGALRPAVAWVCLVTLVVGLAALTVVAPRTRLVPALAIPEPPQVLETRARDVLHAQGLRRAAVDHASGFEYDESVVEHVLATDRSRDRWRSLAHDHPGVVTYWYRESPAGLVPESSWGIVSDRDPPPFMPGMATVRLDLAGRPLGIETPPGGTPADRGGGAAPDPLARPSTIAAAAPGAPARDDPDASSRLTRFVRGTVRPLIIIVAVATGLWLARRNLRAGRGDAARAMRVAAAMLGLRVLVWLLRVHHAPGSLLEQAAGSFAWGALDAGYGAVFYLAVEPYVRRLWPAMLTTWLRLVDGRVGDAQVGRDLVVGCITGVALALAVAAHQALPALFGAPPGRPDNVGFVEHQLASLLSTRQQLGEILWLVRSNLVVLMGFMLILVVTRLVLRNARAAFVAALLLFTPLALPKGELVGLNVALAAASSLLLFTVLLRFGLLAVAVGLVVFGTLQSTPLGMGLDAWPLSRTAVVWALVLGLGLFGFTRSLGGRPAIRDLAP